MTHLSSAVRDGALGLVVAVDMVLRTSALAILFFAGSMAAGVQDAVGVFLATSLIMTCVSIWRIGLPTGLTIVQSEPMAVLLPAAGIVGAANLAPAQSEATGFAVIGLTAILIGVSFWAVTVFRLERFARLMPHAVVVGFLATTGVLLILAALQGLAPSLYGTWAFGPDTQNETVNLILGIGVAVVMWIASRVFPRYGVITVIGAALVAFYTWLAIAGLSLEDAQDRAFLTPAMQGTPNFFYMATGWSDVQWSVVVQTLPHMAAAALVCVLALLLTIGGVEAIIRKDVPVTNVLKTLGPLNIAAGLAGGGAGYLSLASINILATQKGRSIVAGITICAVLLISVINVGLIISYAPTFLTSGLLIFVGIGILWAWLVEQFQKLSTTDWLIAFGIVTVTVLLGILPAVGAGLLLAILIFVINYARLPLIRSTTTLATRRSTVDRDPEQLHYLAENADHVMILSVQGFLFFGSVDVLVSKIRKTSAEDPSVQRLILDFNHVNGIDGAGLEAFRKLEFALETSDLDVSIAGAAPDIIQAFEAAGLGSEESRVSIMRAPIDVALERAEDDVLASLDVPADAINAKVALSAFIEDDRDVDALLERMDLVQCTQGQTLIHAGAEGQEIYLIDSGRFSVMTEVQSGEALRVRSLRPGTFVGEISGYLDQARTADVIAETDSSVFRIGPNFVTALEADAPRLAVQWHRMLAATLAERVDRTNRLLGDLNL